MLVEELIPNALKSQHRAGMARYAETGHGPIIDADAPIEVPALRKSGEQIRVELSLSPVTDAVVPGKFALAIIRDVTEREVLRAKAQHAAVLEERQRLARELHDAVSQTLFAASIIADVVPRLWERNPDEGRRRLVELQQLTRGALAEMRTLLLELRPAALTDTALGELLDYLAQAMGSRARLTITASVEGECPLPPDVQIALYRIAQESLHNVARHAEATAVDLSLRCDREQVELHIRDNGRGFDPCVIPAGHLGVGIMRERAEEVGARITIHSRPGAGTDVQVDWTTAQRAPA
jgi:signal transduction histidine kinase